MAEKEYLLKELEKQFAKAKKELKFKASFEELESIFYISDGILKSGFVSEQFSRQLCSRIIDLYGGWVNYLQSLLFPNPNSLLNLSEAKLLSEEDKKEISKLISQTMALISTNTLLSLKKNKEIEARFIDEAIVFWKKTFHPQVVQLMQKIHTGWKK